ncbi:MAG: GntR family transcriptional regulator [Candidatus Promineifilaceae bacterium]|nr:GntR family transcriptional regulator [Candidatus Promineifilaceae bacterium]
MSSMPNRLNRRSPVALYHQLKRIISSAIDNGEYQVNEQLPSENELSREYGVSRHVVRQALKDLVAEGRIVAYQGSGYFVNKKRVRKLLPRIGSHTSSMANLGIPTQTVVVRQEINTPPESIAERLLPPGEDQAVLIERLSYLNNEPVCFIRAYYPLKYEDALLNVDLDDQSIYATLKERCSLVPKRAETVISVTFADEHQSSLLDVREGMPLLFIGSFTWSAKDELFEHSSGYYRIDRFELEIEQT